MLLKKKDPLKSQRLLYGTVVPARSGLDIVNDADGLGLNSGPV